MSTQLYNKIVYEFVLAQSNFEDFPKEISTWFMSRSSKLHLDCDASHKLYMTRCKTLKIICQRVSLKFNSARQKLAWQVRLVKFARPIHLVGLPGEVPSDPGEIIKY